MHFMDELKAWLAGRGRVQKLAEGCGITHSAVSQWGARVPTERLLDVERITGIPRARLRPDLFEGMEAAQ